MKNSDAYIKKLRLLQTDCDDRCTAQARLQAHDKLEQFLISERWVRERAADEEAKLLEEAKATAYKILSVANMEAYLEEFLKDREKHRSLCSMHYNAGSKNEDSAFSCQFRNFVRRKVNLPTL